MKSRRFKFRILICLLLVITIFFMVSSQEAAGFVGRPSSSATLTATAKVLMPELPTAVLDLSMPAQKEISPELYFPLCVKVWDFNGRTDIEGACYVARFYNAGHAQVGEDVELKLQVLEEEEEEAELECASNFISFSGIANLSGQAEGCYYVYIYRVGCGCEEDKVLPFASSGDTNIKECCSCPCLSCLYLYEDKETLIPYSEDFLRPGCTADWCCGCLCTEQSIKNRIYLKKTPPKKRGGKGFGSAKIIPAPETKSVFGEEDPEKGELISGKGEVRTLLDGQKTLLLSFPKGNCSVLIPEGAASPETEIILRALEPGALPPAPEGQQFASFCFEIEGIEGELSKNARISVPYTEDDLEMVAGNPFELKLAYWNEFKEAWVIMPTFVDTKDKILTSSSRHLGIWAVVSSKAGKSAPPIEPEKPKPSQAENFIQSKVISPIREAYHSIVNWLKELLPG